MVPLIEATSRKQQAGFKMSKCIRYAYMMEYSEGTEYTVLKEYLMKWRKRVRKVYRIKVWEGIQQNVINIFSWKVRLQLTCIYLLSILAWS